MSDIPISIASGTDTVRASLINKEMESSFHNIHEKKLILISFLKLYGTVVFGFFGYGAFLASQYKFENNNPGNDQIILGFIGVVLTLIIFIFGWGVLGLVTNTICGTIKQYKHVSFMRILSAKMFPGNSFFENCVNPIGAKELPIRTSRILPFVFSLVNFLILFAAIYFLDIFLKYTTAVTYVLLPIGLLAIYYPNVAGKYFQELKIATLVRPFYDENNIRKRLERIKNRNKKLIKFKFLYWSIVVISIVYCGSFIINFIQINYDLPIPFWLLLAQGITCGVLAVLGFLITYVKNFRFKLYLKVLPKSRYR